MLMNSANIVLKRAVKNWDDDVTVPFIRRMYDWNMQFSEKEEIKGDHEAYARGTSALLVKEIQAQNIMQLMNLATSPIFAPYVKFPELFRKTVQLMQIPEDEIVKTKEQIGAEEQQASQKPKAQDPEAMKLQMQGQIKQMEMQAKAAELRLKEFEIQSRQQTELAKLAAESQLNIDQLKTQIGIKEAQMHHEKDLMELETMVKAKFGSGL